MTGPSGIEAVSLEAPLGAEIQGVDLARELTPEAVEEFERAWTEHLVLRVRDQEMSDADLLAFSRNFGELDLPATNPYGEPFHKQHPEINVISNLVENGVPKGNLGYGEAVWHADMTYNDLPPKAAVLFALEVPMGEGATYFANMFAAYEALSPNMKVEIEGKVAIHDAAHNSAGMLRKGYEEVTDVRETPGARQTLVRTEPKTGRKALFLSAAARGAMSSAWRSRQATRCWMPCGRTRRRRSSRGDRTGRVGDVLMWRNLCVLHRRDAFDPNARRLLHRTQIKGTEQVA